jgi:hypothetical protein
MNLDRADRICPSSRVSLTNPLTTILVRLPRYSQGRSLASFNRTSPMQLILSAQQCDGINQMHRTSLTTPYSKRMLHCDMMGQRSKRLPSVRLPPSLSFCKPLAARSSAFSNIPISFSQICGLVCNLNCLKAPKSPAKVFLRLHHSNGSVLVVSTPEAKSISVLCQEVRTRNVAIAPSSDSHTYRSSNAM